MGRQGQDQANQLFLNGFLLFLEQIGGITAFGRLKDQNGVI
jgi:hypothetical protein